MYFRIAQTLSLAIAEILANFFLPACTVVPIPSHVLQ